MEIYRRALDQVEKVQSVLITMFYIAIILVVSFQVLNRYVLQWPVLWTADAAVICFVWLGFLCASQSVRRSAHFRMTMLLERRWKGNGKRVLEIFSLLVIVALSTVLLVKGVTITIEGLREISPGLVISMAWSYAAIPVASCTSLLFAIEKLIEYVQGRVADPVVLIEEAA